MSVTLEDIKASGLDYDEYAMKFLLKGKYKHYCPEWDFMAIDEHQPEFLACNCHLIKDEEWLVIQKDLYREIGR